MLLVAIATEKDIMSVNNAKQEKEIKLNFQIDHGESAIVKQTIPKKIYKQIAQVIFFQFL